MLRDEVPGQGLFGSTLIYLECKNVGDVAIPAHGCADVVGAYERLADDGSVSRIVLEVVPPENLGWRPCSVVVGQIPLKAGALGSCTYSPFVKVAYDTTGETNQVAPKKGETWGPVKDGGKVRRWVPGGLCLRDGENGLVLIQRYEPGDLIAVLQSELTPGQFPTGDATNAVLMRYNPNRTSTVKLESTSHQFQVGEATGRLVDIIPATTIFCRWDQTAKRYLLNGYVCP